MIVAMFGAGFETTAHMIGNGMLAMHREPGQWQALVANPEEIAPRAVEEVLRFESSLQGPIARRCSLPWSVVSECSRASVCCAC